MTARTAFLCLALLGAGLAGCLGAPEQPAGTEEMNETGFNTTNPQGQTLLAFEETNATEEGVGGVDHHHDYWVGRTRVEIFSMEAMMQPMGAADAASYEAQATFRPPDGTFVYESTATVEFTISDPKRHVCEGEFTLEGFFVCTDTLDESGAPEVPAQPDPAGGPAGLKLRYKHASTTSWIDVGEIAWGTPSIITITDPIHTDMPHVTSSAWEFQVLSPHKEDSTLVFTAKAEIVRGMGDVPLWPGHPDFYSDSCCRRVVDTLATACDTSACALVSEETDPVAAEKLVSYGTRTLHVWINITEVFSPNPALQPDVWFLWHWNSTGRENITDVFDKVGHGFETREHYWILPVDDNGMDSPYADGSKWRLQLGGAFYKEGVSCYGGCADWNAKYSIVAIATNEVLDPELYTMRCLRDDYCPQPGDEGGSDLRTMTRDERVA